MKRTGLVLCVCLVSLILLLCACQTPNESNGETPTTTLPAQNIQEAQKDSNQTNNETTTPEWKTAYLEFIENNKGAYTSFSLVFVDDDDVPELYMSGVDEAQGDLLCSYKNGTVVDAYMNRISGGKYVERGGTVINQNGHMGRYYTTVYKLDENGFTKVLSALLVEHVEFVENTDDSGRPGAEEYIISYEYSIEGQPVSEDEYNAAIHTSFGFANGVGFYEIAVSYDIIKQQITDWK